MHTSSTNYKQLQPEDRMMIASLRQQNFSIRRIAMVLQRSPSTISRELTRNSEQGTYASVNAQRSCHQRRNLGRPDRKLHSQYVLFGMVHTLLCSRWSPEQIALTLARLYSKGHRLRVSHETIYNCIYAQPVGELRKELIANLRQARNKRTPRSKPEFDTKRAK
jgi:IS30 family transposase